MTAILNVHFTAQADNRKTGPIPVTTRPADTCPSDCPFLPGNANGGGCYGTGLLFGQARKLAAGTTVAEATAKLDRHMWRGARYLRDRVVGDVVGPTGKLDRRYVIAVAKVAANLGITAFGYSHMWRRFTPRDVALFKASGYVMNASTETTADVELAVEMGLPVAMVNDDLPDGTVIAGKRLVTCPAVTNKGVTCASCGLCAKPDRPSIIRFFTHGSVAVRRRAQRAIAYANAAAEPASPEVAA